MKRTPNAYIVCKYCTFSGPAILVLDTGACLFPLHDVWFRNFSLLGLTLLFTTSSQGHYMTLDVSAGASAALNGVKE